MKGADRRKPNLGLNWLRELAPTAVMVDVSREDFPALARMIRDGINKEVTGNHVVGIRQAKSGALLIEVRGDPAQVKTVNVA